MSKRFVLDSSVLLNSPYAINAFDEHDVYIPASVLAELREKALHGTGETRANANELFRLLDQLATSSSLHSFAGGIPLKTGGNLFVGTGKASDSICSVAKEVGGILVSREPAIRVLAHCSGIACEDYKADTVSPSGMGYCGRCSIIVSDEDITRFADERKLPVAYGQTFQNADDPDCSNYSLQPNEFITLINANNPMGATMIGRYNAGQQAIVPILYYDKTHPVYGVTPRNLGQVFALEALLAPAEVAPLVILKGPAGTAKTFLSMAAGLEQAYENANYRRVLATRSNTEMDKTLGYLKGGEFDKLSPLLRPIFDNIENLHAKDPGKRQPRKDGVAYEDPSRELVETGAVVIQSMGYMRGRSINETYIIIDEAQNMSPTQVLSMITRAGEGSKIVLLGDPDQIDNPYLDRRNNGLTFASEKMRGSPLCWQVAFQESECTRSPLAKDAVSRLTPKGVGPAI